MARVLHLLAQQGGDLGGGRIDNVIVAPWVHRLNGALTVAALLAAAIWLTRLALRRAPFDKVGQVLVVSSQVLLVVQALLGIKLLDQGMVVVQLYIHYVGGLLPLGLFLVLGWVRFRRPCSPGSRSGRRRRHRPGRRRHGVSHRTDLREPLTARRRPIPRVSIGLRG